MGSLGDCEPGTWSHVCAVVINFVNGERQFHLNWSLELGKINLINQNLGPAPTKR